MVKGGEGGGDTAWVGGGEQGKGEILALWKFSELREPFGPTVGGATQSEPPHRLHASPSFRLSRRRAGQPPSSKTISIDICSSYIDVCPQPADTHLHAAPAAVRISVAAAATTAGREKRHVALGMGSRARRSRLLRTSIRIANVALAVLERDPRKLTDAGPRRTRGIEEIGGWRGCAGPRILQGRIRAQDDEKGGSTDSGDAVRMPWTPLEIAKSSRGMRRPGWNN